MNGKLLFVAPALGYGGAEKNLLGIATFALQSGFEVHILTEEGSEDARPVNPSIVRHYSKKINQRNTIAQMNNCIHEVVKVIQDIKPDVVISFIDLWRVACVIACKLTGVKCVVSERADPYSRNGKYDKIIFFLFSLADGFVFQTEQAKAFFSKRVQRKAAVIPNPVFKDDVLPPYTGEKKDILVSIARLDLKQKRQDVLIKAFTHIAEEFPNLQLCLYGSGPDEQRIREMINKTCFSDRIHLMGVTHNVYQAVGEARIMVLSSDYEGIPNAVIESMCVGVPVVSTKCSPGGAELLIDNRVNGILVDCGDDIGMSNAISDLLTQQDLYITIKKNGLNVKELFSEEKVLSQWMNYIDRIQRHK